MRFMLFIHALLLSLMNTVQRSPAVADEPVMFVAVVFGERIKRMLLLCSEGVALFCARSWRAGDCCPKP